MFSFLLLLRFGGSDLPSCLLSEFLFLLLSFRDLLCGPNARSIDSFLCSGPRRFDHLLSTGLRLRNRVCNHRFCINHLLLGVDLTRSYRLYCGIACLVYCRRYARPEVGHFGGHSCRKLVWVLYLELLGSGRTTASPHHHRSVAFVPP